MDKSIMLSFDVEEFDIIEEYGQKINNETKLKKSLHGLNQILDLLDELNIKATFFVTGYFANNNKEIIRKISEKHEIASHGHYHSSFSSNDLTTSKILLEKITNKEINGFRMPRLKEINLKDLAKRGYKYDSSINPTWIPGRYNNFFKKRTAYYSGDLFNIPISVTPFIRFPLFWLSFKNIPLIFIKIFSKINLASDKYINIYFHPWEFTDLDNFRLPIYIKRISGKKLLDKLRDYLIWLKRRGNFITISKFMAINKKNQGSQ